MKNSSFSLKAILDQSIVGIAVTDLRGKFIEVNDFYAKLTGRTTEELRQMGMQEITHPDDIPRNMELFKEMVKTGKGFTIEKRYLRPDGSYVWVDNSVSLITNTQGGDSYISAVCKDITAQKNAEEIQQRMNSRMKLLADASKVLLESPLQLHERVKIFAELVVPTIADWCVIDLFSSEGNIESSTIIHRDPSKIELARELRNSYPPERDAIVGTYHVFKTHKTDFVAEIPDHLLKQVSRDERHYEILKSLSLFSFLSVPILAHGEVLGVLTLANEAEAFSQDEVILAEELSRRAAYAINNAKLFSTSQEAIQARDEFLSIASHELKTPVTSLKIQTQLFRRKTVSGDSELLRKASSKLLDVYERNIERLNRLIDDMLDISRITHGQLQLHFQPGLVEALIENSLERLQNEIQSAGIVVKTQLTEGLKVNCDVFRLEQVIANIITNAIKYAPDTELEIGSVEKDGKVIVSFKDHGPGIAQDNLKRIFTRFERAVSANISGLGLGLYISRQIMEAHGGEIWAESQEGIGSHFFISLPSV